MSKNGCSSSRSGTLKPNTFSTVLLLTENKKARLTFNMSVRFMAMGYHESTWSDTRKEMHAPILKARNDLEPILSRGWSVVLDGFEGDVHISTTTLHA
jgi:hypothetical protein